jgi:RNA-binding motif protein, X-linked 2
MAVSSAASLKKLQDEELRTGAAGTSRSWHRDFKSSAAVVLRGLDPRLTEGDIVTVLSQFGEIVDLFVPRQVELEGGGGGGGGRPSRQEQRERSQQKGGPQKLVRRGFAFAVYEDQRSTDLAVDNLTGTTLLGRTLSCEHVLDFRVPEEDAQWHSGLLEELQGGDQDVEEAEEGRDSGKISLRALAKAPGGEDTEKAKPAYVPMAGGDEDTSDPAGSSSETRDSSESGREDADEHKRKRRHHSKKHKHKHKRKRDKKKRRSKHERTAKKARGGESRVDQRGSVEDVMDARSMFADLEAREKEPAVAESAAVVCSNCGAGHPVWECPAPHAAPAPPRVAHSSVRPETFRRPTWQDIVSKRKR